MSADSNVEFVKDLFAAFGRGDIGYVIDPHADHIVMVFTIRDGKVARFRHFYDPGDIEVAM